MVKERIERAKRSAIPEDYEDLKAKAARFDEIEEQGKTKLQKAQEEAAAAQRELDASALARSSRIWPSRSSKRRACSSASSQGRPRRS